MRFQRTKQATKPKDTAKAPGVNRPKEITRTRQEVAPENRFARFWRETLAELRKVVWPTREQAVNLTAIVVATVVTMSLFLGAIDYILTQVVRIILGR